MSSLRGRKATARRNDGSDIAAATEPAGESPSDNRSIGHIEVTALTETSRSNQAIAQQPASATPYDRQRRRIARYRSAMSGFARRVVLAIGNGVIDSDEIFRLLTAWPARPQTPTTSTLKHLKPKAEAAEAAANGRAGGSKQEAPGSPLLKQ